LDQAADNAPLNQKVLFNLALIHADTRNITHALKLVRKSLELNASHVRSWVLLALLLTSRKQVPLH